MTFLFGRGTPREKLAFILRATKQHALNLGTFTPLYKFITIALRRLFEAVGGKGDVPKWHSLVAGLVGGYVVFGERTPVNEQVSLLPLRNASGEHAVLAIKEAERGLLTLAWLCLRYNWVDCTVYVFEDHGIVLAESQDARGLAQGQAQAD